MEETSIQSQSMQADAEPRKRHGGIWIWEIAAWAIVGDFLVAWGIFH